MFYLLYKQHNFWYYLQNKHCLKMKRQPAADEVHYSLMMIPPQKVSKDHKRHSCKETAEDFWGKL